MQKEIWKPIEGFEEYEISNLGRVRSWKGVNGKRQVTPHILNATVQLIKEKKDSVSFNIGKNLPKYFPVNKNNEE